MPQRTLKFLIRQDGFVEESVEGVVGQSCHQLTERLEEALGVVDKSQPTSDSYQSLKDQANSLPAELI